MTSDRDNLLEALWAKTYAEATGTLDDQGRMIVRIPEGIQPGDLIIIEVTPPSSPNSDAPHKRDEMS